MDEPSLREALAGIPLGAIRYFNRIGSTNEVALAWAGEGAPDLALVYAEEQTAGRGRAGRTWFSPRGAALALSLVLRPTPAEQGFVARYTALGALAAAEALVGLHLPAEIKWPNDVLIHQRKVCGVLAEAIWQGKVAESVVLGIGVNVRPEAVPPPEGLNFPATSLEAEAGTVIERLPLIRAILLGLLRWRPQLGTTSFLQAWEGRLAFRGQQVQVRLEGRPEQIGRLEGLDPDGSLRLRSPEGTSVSIQLGEVHLRPVVV
ncbi:MAG: biotin--[acetyl-CoA-carboxylase] ligase [Anaerolineales bacterium]|jgi:BirA family biotin operon repressor/biotin-[acetyl-CoA-carboxylase] ligase